MTLFRPSALELNVAKADVVGVAPYGEPLDAVRVQFRRESKMINLLQKRSRNLNKVAFLNKILLDQDVK